MLKKLTYLTYKKLQTKAGEGLVTIYIPLVPGAFGHKQNKSQLHAIRSELKKHVTGQQHARLSVLLDDTHAALGYVHTCKGLLVTIQNDSIKVYELPFTPNLIWHKNATYNLQQVKEYYASNSPFYVLAISKKGSHLFKGDKTKLTHVAVEEIEHDVNTVLRLDEGAADTLQNHAEGVAGRRGAAGFHGHGGKKEVKKTLYESYLRFVDKKIMNTIQDKKTPLVLVAVGYGQTMFRNVSAYPSIAAKSLTTNPDDLSTHDLHNKIVPMMY